MIEKIFIFFLFLGPLVFFHELGHFLFARLFGVRVETFSIGFGPKLFKFKRGDTVYALSLIPLGGYVKMFGDDPLSEEEMSPEDAKVAYTKKGKWARFWIVFGGPLANFIFAFFLYFTLIMSGEKVPQAKMGFIESGTTLHNYGIRTGDILLKINELEVVSFDDLNFVDSQIEKLVFQRNGKKVVLDINVAGMDFLKQFANVNTPLRAPIVTSGSSDNYLLTDSSNKIRTLEELLVAPLKKIRAYKINTEVPMEFKSEEYVLKGLPFQDYDIADESLAKFLNEKKLYSRDLYVKNILMGSAAEKASLKKGDILISLDGKKLESFTDLKKVVQSLKEPRALELVVFSEKQMKKLTLTPTYKEHNGKKYLSIGVESGISFFSFMVTTSSKSLADSIVRSYRRTIDGIVKTFLGFKKLITGEVSLDNVGGPIAIGQVASESFNISLSMFFRLMAIISINLGVINLFPIPVLDGGHIVFIFLEILNRGPLSRKKMMYAQQVGMSLLFLLIFVALYNDISRFF